MKEAFEKLIRYVCTDICQYRLIHPDMGDRQKYCSTCGLIKHNRKVIMEMEKHSDG